LVGEEEMWPAKATRTKFHESIRMRGSKRQQKKKKGKKGRQEEQIHITNFRPRKIGRNDWGVVFGIERKTQTRRGKDNSQYNHQVIEKIGDC